LPLKETCLPKGRSQRLSGKVPTTQTLFRLQIAFHWHIVQRIKNNNMVQF
jgi:hypothetical protein